MRYVSILLNEGADPNTVDGEGKTALMHSCFVGNEKATKALLHHVRIIIEIILNAMSVCFEYKLYSKRAEFAFLEYTHFA